MATGEGTAFGKYFLLKKIAAGGMGEIYLAKIKGPVGFEKLLVIKRILAHHVENQEFVDMFFAEARVAAQFNHSNVIQIYEMGEIDDAYFIAMEYVHGKSLRDVIDRARELGGFIPIAHTIDMISKLCDGLSYAHNSRDMSGQALQIIHRDVNPHNTLVSYSGDVKIIDFGIAKSEMSLNKTETGTIKGKFVYMSPEQSAAEKLDKRSDIFAVGICLYECLCGMNPFAKANVVLSLDAIQRRDPPPVSEVNPAYSVLEPIVKKALAKNRDERYADCSEMRADLQQLLNGGAIARPGETLSEYMTGLFAEHIEREKRMIIETDSANTQAIEKMRAYSKLEHSSASGKQRAHRGTAGTSELPAMRETDGGGEYGDEPEPLAAHAGAVALEMEEDEERSRLPFYLLLAAIIVSSVIAAVGVSKLLKKPGTSSVVALSPEPPADGQASPPIAAAPVAGFGAAPVAPTGVTPAVTPAPTPGAVAATPAPADAAKPEAKTDPRDDRRRDSRDRDRDRRAPTPAATPSSSKAPESFARPAPEPPTPPPPPPSAPAPAAPPKAAPPPPAAEQTFGNMQISTTPPVRITRNNQPVGQTLVLKGSSGILVFGTGSDPTRDPFVVRVRYQVKGESISYAVDAEPWAIVRGKNGIGLGKTPLPAVDGEGSAVLELLNPKEGLRLRINLRYSAD